MQHMVVFELSMCVVIISTRIDNIAAEYKAWPTQKGIKYFIHSLVETGFTPGVTYYMGSIKYSLTLYYVEIE